MLPVVTTLAGKVAIGLLAGGAAVIGGTAVAAYAHALPPAAQQIAHDTIGAPSPTDASDTNGTPTATPTATPVGPDATGPAAYGLCTAFGHGGLNVSSTAYASLAKAANGAANIAAYCATIPAPHATPTSTHTPNSHSTTHPTHTPAPNPGSTHKPAPGTHP